MEFPEPLLERLRTARRWVVLTGAGISAESGIPTFRDALTGLWAQYDPEELATPQAFRKNPKLVWEWYAMRRETIQKADPNPGHRALAAVEKKAPEFLLVTQNVDGLHGKAGSRKLIEIHGNINRTRCFSENTVVEEWQETTRVPPVCPNCGGWLRPDVVWFGEALPTGAYEMASEAAGDCDVFLSVGTSGLVYPAAGLPMEASRHRATVVEINRERTPLTPGAHYFLQGRSGEILPALVEKIWN